MRVDAVKVKFGVRSLRVASPPSLHSDFDSFLLLSPLTSHNINNLSFFHALHIEFSSKLQIAKLLFFLNHHHPFRRRHNHSTVFGEEIKLISVPIIQHTNSQEKIKMSLKPSNSSEDPMLPVSDPAKEQNGADKLFKGSAMTKRGAYAAVSYMSCAVLLVMFNKAALSSYNFPSANVITLLQMICSCCFLYVLRLWRIISFTAGESIVVSDNSTKFVSLKTLKHTLPLSGAYLLYMLVTMESVRGVNVPMYTTLRRTTVVFTMAVEFFLVQQRYTPSVIFSVGLIVFGALIAGVRDFSFDAYGYAIVVLANLTTAIYLATIARIGKTSGLNSFGLMWCNGIICGPVLLVWTFIRGDLKMTISFPYLFSPGFMVVLLFSCILAFFLNYCIFLNTTLNSALTQTICGNLKDLFTIGLGWAIFGGLPFDFWNVIGQLLGFAGSGLYAYYKLIGK